MAVLTFGYALIDSQGKEYRDHMGDATVIVLLLVLILLAATGHLKL